MVFGSITDPHVLHLYVPDKLLAREIAYWTVEKGIMKNLEDAKKQLWPTFPIQCNIYSLHDYKHAQFEAEKTKGLNLAVILKTQYDSKKVAFNFTTQVKVNQLAHEKYEFNDLFTLLETFTRVIHMAKIKLGSAKMDQFIQYIMQRLQTVPLDLLNTVPVIQKIEKIME